MRRIFNAITFSVLALVLASGIANAVVSGSNEARFRATVAFRPNLFTGVLVDTKPYERHVRERYSTIVVRDVICGQFAPGDSVVVSWGAAKWYPKHGGVASRCPAGPQLSEFECKYAFWAVSERNGELHTREPIILSPDNKPQIQQCIAVLECPPEDDFVADVLSSGREGYPSETEVAERLELVRHYLDRYLVELVPPDERGIFGAIQGKR